VESSAIVDLSTLSSNWKKTRKYVDTWQVGKEKLLITSSAYEAEYDTARCETILARLAKLQDERRD
jgi:hypothetical protein